MPKHSSTDTLDPSIIPASMQKRLREALFIVIAAGCLFLLLAFITYHQSDPSWSHTGTTTHIANRGGRAGAFFADIFLYAFGYMAYLFPLIAMLAAWHFSRIQQKLHYWLLAIRAVGFLLILAGSCGLASLEFFNVHGALPFTVGGVFGNVTGLSLAKLFNPSGAALLLLTCLLCGVTLMTGLSWLVVVEQCGKGTLLLARRIKMLLNREKRESKATEPTVSHSVMPTEVKTKPRLKKSAKKAENKEKIKTEQPITINNKVEKIKPSKRFEKERQGQLFADPVQGSLPALSLLETIQTNNKKVGYSEEQLEAMSREVEQRLLDFNVSAQVVAVHPGPVVTRFELQLAPGVKVSKISALAKDLARSLSVISVRVVEVIPGKPVIGIELPNQQREVVSLNEVLASQHYDNARSPISLALGKDIAGHPVIVDLAKMPHLLVAGTTGSGKSVGLNAMLLSILFKATPSQVRLILIDPKMLELSVYEGIPHLLAPVVTDMKEAANSLRWSVAEMERRYRLMAALGVRNLAGYNNKIADAEKKGEPLLDPLWQQDSGTEQSELEKLPYIVVVIDELADMMMVVGKKVEQLIARIAQKARAAGIHLILATQRPSVDVITGLIKSNIPTRIAFQVSSKIDSRTILDQQGAEQLLGHGDMLYMSPGSGTPVRVHGAFVQDKEVHRVAEDWKRRGEPEYIEDITAQDAENPDRLLPGESAEDAGGSGEGDALYDQVVEFVTETRKVSISSVQRRFKIGYNRAARLVEDMEQAGVVSPMESNGAREVLAPKPPPRD